MWDLEVSIIKKQKLKNGAVIPKNVTSLDRQLTEDTHNGCCADVPYISTGTIVVVLSFRQNSTLLEDVHNWTATGILRTPFVKVEKN